MSDADDLRLARSGSVMRSSGGARTASVPIRERQVIHDRAQCGERLARDPHDGRPLGRVEGEGIDGSLEGGPMFTRGGGMGIDGTGRESWLKV